MSIFRTQVTITQLTSGGAPAMGVMKPDCERTGVWQDGLLDASGDADVRIPSTVKSSNQVSHYQMFIMRNLTGITITERGKEGGREEGEGRNEEKWEEWNEGREGGREGKEGGKGRSEEGKYGPRERGKVKKGQEGWKKTVYNEEELGGNNNHGERKRKREEGRRGKERGKMGGVD